MERDRRAPYTLSAVYKIKYGEFLGCRKVSSLPEGGRNRNGMVD